VQYVRAIELREFCPASHTMVVVPGFAPPRICLTLQPRAFERPSIISTADLRIAFLFRQIIPPIEPCVVFVKAILSLAAGATLTIRLPSMPRQLLPDRQ
jgi:hypothetical protein